MDVVIGRTERTGRLIGIEAPQPGGRRGQEALSNQARQSLILLIGEGAATLVSDVQAVDDEELLLRHVLCDDMVIAVELARQGWLRASEMPPNLLFRD